MSLVVRRKNEIKIKSAAETYYSIEGVIKNMKVTDLMAYIALAISILNVLYTLIKDNYLYKPLCRVAAESKPRGIKIVLENVCNRTMYVHRIGYYIKDKTSYTTNLSGLFYSVPCETRSEARLRHIPLFSNSSHYLLSITFDSQEELLMAWEIIKSLMVVVEYRGYFRRHITKVYDLKNDYDCFMDALNDGKGGLRKLKAFLKDTTHKKADKDDDEELYDYYEKN